MQLTIALNARSSIALTGAALAFYIGRQLYRRLVVYNASVRFVGNVHQSWYTSLCLRLTSSHDASWGAARLVLESMDLGVPQRINAVHSHPVSAAWRNLGVISSERAAGLLGTEVYSLQKSKCDERHGRAGCRTYHWGKDTNVEFSLFDPPPHCVVMISDVDQYLKMPELLAEYPRVYAISTFQPDAVCGTGEFSFTFDKLNRVSYRVAGGALYEHTVWSYGSDVIFATSYLGYWRWRATTYSVVRKQLGPMHQLIFLVPQNSFKSYIWDPSAWLGGHTLRLLRVAVQIKDRTFLRMTVQRGDGLYISTGIAGEHACATIPAPQDNALAGMQENYTTNLTAASVQAVVGDLGAPAITALVSYHRAAHGQPSDTVYSSVNSFQRYQFDPPSFDPEASNVMHAYMPAIIGGAFAPDRTRANEQAAVDGRILTVRPKGLTMTPMLSKFIAEFTVCVVPVRGGLIPLSVDEVYDKQRRQAQVRILDEGSMSLDVVGPPIVKSFIKAESYAEPKDPRVISTVQPTTKLNYARYMYPVSEYLRTHCPWSGVGLTPLATATRVAGICAGASNVAQTDFSRFDGRVSFILREVERVFMLRLYPEEYHEELLEIMARNQDCKARTRMGVQYTTKSERLSGGQDTIDFNSLDISFIAFVAIRTTRYGDGFLEAAMAYRKLCEQALLVGDDGLCADVDKAAYVKAAEMVGQVLVIDIIQRGQRGVSFLARIYSPRVWFGCPDSMCDLVRQLTKLHLTTSQHRDVPMATKFSERMTGYFLSDRNTPIIGDIARHLSKLGELCDLSVVQFSAHAAWAARCELSVQYPNADEECWMLHEVELALPGFRGTEFWEWLGSMDSIERFSQPHATFWDPQPPKIARAVVANGQVHHPPAPAGAGIKGAANNGGAGGVGVGRTTPPANKQAPRDGKDKPKGDVKRRQNAGDRPSEGGKGGSQKAVKRRKSSSPRVAAVSWYRGTLLCSFARGFLKVLKQTTTHTSHTMPLKKVRIARRVKVSRGAPRRQRTSVSVPVAMPAPAVPTAQAGTQRLGSVGKRGGAMTQRREEGAAASYLRTIMYPFADADPLPKVPDDICVRTISVRTKIATTVSCVPSGNGVGSFVACLTPFYNVWDSITTPSSGPALTNVPSTYYPDMYPLSIANTAAAFSSAGAQQLWGQGLQWQASPDMLYASSNGGPTGDGVLSEARTVSAGLRLTFTGNYTNTDGIIYACVIPKNAIVPFWYYLNNLTPEESLQQVTAPRTLSEVINTFGVQAYSAQGGVEIHWVPQDPQSVTFTQIGKEAARRKTQVQLISVATGPSPPNTYSELEQLNGIPSIFVWGANLNAAGSFLVEATAVHECTLAPGISSFLPSTPSPVDPVGFAKALQVAAKLPTTKPSPRSMGGAMAQAGASSIVDSVGSAFGRVAERGIGMLEGMATRGLNSLMGGLFM